MIMVINALLFFAPIIALTWIIYKISVNKTDITVFLIVVFCEILVMTQYDAFPETFFWYTGATNYSMPLTMAIIAVSIVLMNEKKSGRSVMAIILVLLAAGGVLPIGGALCYSLLLILVYRLLTLKKLDVDALVVFIFSFVGTLVNFLSPGYRIRQGIESNESSSILNSVGYTVEVIKGLFEWLYSRNYLAVIVILISSGVFAAVFGMGAKFKTGAYVIVSVLALGIPFVTVFPVVYGYNVPWMPNRCLFITLFVVDMVLGNLSILFGVLMWKILKENMVIRGAAAVVAVLSLAFLFAVIDYPPTEYKVAKINKKLIDRDYQSYYYETRELLENLSDRAGEDVVLDVATQPMEIRDFYNFFLVDPDDDKVNRCVAWVYGLNSISNSRYKQ